MKGKLVMVIFILAFFSGCEEQAEMLQYGQVKAKQTEAKTNLTAIYTAQVGFRAMSRRYGENFSEIGYAITENQRYSYFMCDDVLEGYLGPDSLPDNLSPPACSSDKFLVYAIANLDNDDTLDIWSIDQDHNLRMISSDLK